MEKIEKITLQEFFRQGDEEHKELAIHTNTKEEYTQLCQIFHEMGGVGRVI